VGTRGTILVPSCLLDTARHDCRFSTVDIVSDCIGSHLGSGLIAESVEYHDSLLENFSVSLSQGLHVEGHVSFWYRNIHVHCHARGESSGIGAPRPSLGAITNPKAFKGLCSTRRSCLLLAYVTSMKQKACFAQAVDKSCRRCRLGNWPRSTDVIVTAHKTNARICILLRRPRCGFR
jgi:hypothetical protein